MNNADLLEAQRRLQRQHGITPPPAPAAPDPAAVAAAMVNMVAAVAEKGAHKETEYLAADGLLRCKICGGPRQTVITPPFEGAQARTVRCWCQCPTDYDKLRQQEKLWKRETDRCVCFKSMPKFQGWTFDKADDRQQELMQAAREYADQFQDHLKDGRGLLFYGTVGTGKSVAAACIANAVIEKGYRVKMTNFSTVADEIWNAENKAAYVESLCKYDLLILDDLGAERNTQYMQEMVYKIVNARYAQGGPVIVTTNLTQQEMLNPADIEYKRIYSRLLEWCMTVNVEGKDRRLQAGAMNRSIMCKQLGIGGAGA